MRLAFIVHQFLPRHVTGTEQYVRSLALGLRRRGHDVRVFAFEPQLHVADPQRTWLEEDAEVDGIPVRRVGIDESVLSNRELTDYHNPIVERLLGRFLEALRPELVHVFHLRNIGIGGILEPVRLGIPVVVNLMDFWFLCPRFTLLHREERLCEGPPEGGVGCIDCLSPPLAELLAPAAAAGTLRRLGADPRFPADFRATPAHRAHALIGRKERLLGALARADAVVTPSRFLGSVFVRHGFPEPRLEHVPYGVDPDRLAGEAVARGPLRDRAVDVGYVGSLTPHKGVHVLIAALRGIAGDGWRLHVHGSEEVHPAYARLLRERAGDDPRVRFHGGFRPRELGRVLGGIDVLAAPSLWAENTPFTVLEARMAGLPVIASDLGGIAEVVQHGRDGFLFEAGNVAALAAVLREVLVDPTRLAALRVAARPRTLDDNLDDFLTLYRRLVQSPAPAGGAMPR